MLGPNNNFPLLRRQWCHCLLSAGVNSAAGGISRLRVSFLNYYFFKKICLLSSQPMPFGPNQCYYIGRCSRGVKINIVVIGRPLCSARLLQMYHF